MPIRDCPFTHCGNGIYRPILPIIITNPHTGRSLQTFGIIDTGADECAVPAGIAPILGHNLHSGSIKSINTGNGVTLAYSHATKFEILHPATSEHLYTITNTPVDFMPNLNVVLLGVKTFLSSFELNINYPQKSFSIIKP